MFSHLKFPTSSIEHFQQQIPPQSELDLENPIPSAPPQSYLNPPKSPIQISKGNMFSHLKFPTSSIEHFQQQIPPQSELDLENPIPSAPPQSYLNPPKSPI
jgi:hypothetical protein